MAASATPDTSSALPWSTVHSSCGAGEIYFSLDQFVACMTCSDECVRQQAVGMYPA